MKAADLIARDNALADAGLSLLWPGLGQLHQGRPFAALYFGVESLSLVAVFTLFPPWRAMAAVGFAAVALWSIIDAFRAVKCASSPGDAAE
jgi:hypothetical protein